VLLLMLSPYISDDIVLYVALVQRMAFIFSYVISWGAGKALERRANID